VFGWFVLMIMFELDLCNNDIVVVFPQFHLVYRFKI
jgi:hypothetical protein